jgi:long-chain acyl-CoA synthetase
VRSDRSGYSGRSKNTAAGKISVVNRWLAHYDPDVAQTVAPYPERTLLDYLRELARDHGDTPALLFKGATMSYAEMEQHSNACAAALAAIGVRPGDRVALLLPNCPQFMVAQYGVWKAGGIVVALNPIYS